MRVCFLGDARKAAIVLAMSMSVILLLPASLGFGCGTIIITEASAQFNLPILEEDEVLVMEKEEDTATPTALTTPPPPTITTTYTTLQQIHRLTYLI